jgi:UDP-glucose 4-epimerase
MRVLVTGGSGFIGSAVRRELESRGSEFVPFDHPNDIRNAKAVDVATGRVDAVINLAGILGTSETFGSEREVVDVNIGGALVVADACRANGVPMVQIGTGHKGQPNPYAITKACTEDLLLARGDRVNVVRAFHAYGPAQKAFPPHGRSTVRKIIPSFVCRALSGMPIEINGDGNQVVDMIHVDEVARILVDALDGPHGQTYEAGTGVGMTVNDVAADVIAACGSRSQIVHLPKRQGEPEGAVVVADKPLSDKPWPYGLDETIDYYRQVVG